MENGVGKVSILGVGLIGGSIAKALKERGSRTEVSVWSRSASTRQKCCAMGGVFDRVCPTPAEAVRGADMVFLCAPTDTIPNLAGEISPHLKEGAIVTDVGSVKSEICSKCSRALEAGGGIFIGSHPMAGSEKTGVENAQGSLFDGRMCMVTPSGETAERALKAVCDFWRGLGMEVRVLSPGLHDKIVACVSHVPHLVAGALCKTAADSNVADIFDFIGPGFKDCTRVASGSPDIWLPICRDNRGEILAALRRCRDNLDALERDLERSDFNGVSEFLRNAKSIRDSLRWK